MALKFSAPDSQLGADPTFDAPQQRQRQQQQPKDFQLFPDGTIEEARGQALLAIAIFLAALAGLLVLAQLSYDPLDPSLNTATARLSPANWLGTIGATWSDLGFQLFGWALWLIPFFLVIWAITIIVHDRVGFLPLRLLALPVALGLASVLLTVPGWVTGWSKPAFAGGAIGDLILGNAAHWLRFPEWLTATLCLFFLPLICAWLLAQSRSFWGKARQLSVQLVLGIVGGATGLTSLFRSGSSAAGASADGGLTQRPWFKTAGRQAGDGMPIFVQRERVDPESEPEPNTIAEDRAAFTPPAEDTTAPPPARPRFQPLHDDEDPLIDDALSQQLDNLDALDDGLDLDLDDLDDLDRPFVAYDDRSDDPFLREPHFDNASSLDGLEDGEPEDIDQQDLPPQTELLLTPSADIAKPAPTPLRPAEPKKAAPPKASGGKSASTARTPSYDAPSLELLQAPDPDEVGSGLTREQMEDNAEMLTEVLRDFGVKGEITNVRPGPVVTLYELKPAPGTKTSRVVNLADDIARSMSALSARIAVVPGRNVIGIELPNPGRETVYLREMLETAAYQNASAKLPLALGKDIGGGPVYVDLARMPHLLVAGTTGSGKSVAVNTMILSLLYSLPPERCKFIMIDPKMLELSVYDGIPHLLSPVVTEPKKAVVALNWAVREMEERYRAMSNLSVRNIEGYNKRLAQARTNGEVLTRKVQTGFDIETGAPEYEEQDIDLTALPFIVIIVDEMADLMLVAGKEIEGALQRLAQMARAAGIHLVMATQRPSVDVITGTIKANFPTRISFHVTSKIDSRTILGEMGAEQLLGQGDMLYMPSGGRTQRVHGPFASDDEVEEIVRHLRDLGEPSYIDEISEEPPESFGEGAGGELGTTPSGDDLYDQAVATVLRDKKASTSYVQRRLQIGYNRAARLIERMEAEGLISAANNKGRREILAGNPDP